MSRIAKHPIKLPSGVEARMQGSKLFIKGKKGELSLEVSNDLTTEIKDGAVNFEKVVNTRHASCMYGTTASLVRGMIAGVSEGFVKRLVIDGVGFRAALQGKDLVLQIGFSHEVRYKVPQGIEIKVPKPTEIEVYGIDKQKVGQVAAELYLLKRPEPYKGKGINYEGRRIRRKEGKKK